MTFTDISLSSTGLYIVDMYLIHQATIHALPQTHRVGPDLASESGLLLRRTGRTPTSREGATTDTQ